MFQTPEGKPQSLHILRVLFTFSHPILFDVAEAIDQWFENLQNYEATLVSCMQKHHRSRF